MQDRYCSCVLKVASKQPRACNRERAWRETRDGHTCYNPYAVCTASVGRQSKECGDKYSWDNLTDDEIRSYADLSGVDFPDDASRDQVLAAIKRTKLTRYG